MIILQTDGSIQGGNPGGHACWGFVAIDSNGEELHSDCGSLGSGPGWTNNLAEYAGIIEALRWAYKNGHKDGIIVQTDSQLCANQINRLWSCNDQRLIQRRKRVLDAMQLMDIKVEYIPREMNRRADEVSRRIYREADRKNRLRAAESSSLVTDEGR